MTEDSKNHRNDIYGDITRTPAEENPAIPAATVVLLRESSGLPEVLMVHRTSKVHFGGMWVFPGGRIDPEDYPAGGDVHEAARNAAVRETLEEIGVTISADEFVYFAHWTPPATTPRRYATWFFAKSLAGEHEIEVDGHEIQDHGWVSPAVMLERHKAGEVDLAPPTWITLYTIARHGSVAAGLAHLDQAPEKIYETHIGLRDDGIRVAMWHGDAGYETTNPNLNGARHRLILDPAGFEFDHGDIAY